MLSSRIPIPFMLDGKIPTCVLIGGEYYVDYNRTSPSHVCCFQEYGLRDHVRCNVCGKCLLREQVPFYRSAAE